jgi:hypothetical protein
MDDPLIELKRRIRNDYLGRGGIHGIGVSRSQNAISVYVDKDAVVDPVLLDDLARRAEPYAVLLVRQDKSSTTEE